MPAAAVEMGSHISLCGAQQPSLLEVTAQDSLLSGLQPAFLHLLKVLDRLVPYLGAVERRCGAELFLVLHGALQYFCLKYHDASFSEHYYDLKRVDLRALKAPPTGRAATHSLAPETLTPRTFNSDPAANDHNYVQTSQSSENTIITNLISPQPVASQALESVAVFGESQLSSALSPNSVSEMIVSGSSEANSAETFLPFVGPDVLPPAVDAVQIKPKCSNFSTRSKFKSLFSVLSFKVFHNLLPSWLMQRLQFPQARSLAVLALLPYLQQKISELYERNIDRQQSGVRGKALQLWPLVQLCAEVANVCYYLRYMGGTSPVCSLSHAASGVTLVRSTEEEEEMRQQALEQLSWKERLASEAPAVLMDVLEASAFLLQFLDWWYSNDRDSSSASTTTATNSTTPPFPHLPLSGDETVCPICHAPPQQPTALAVSGLVFCYACILRHVRGSLCCPVTGYPASTGQLVRIYHE